MSDLEIFEQVCRAMADPAFYPHPVSGPQKTETLISTVFLTGDFVYKLKKPVDFGFLDYTGLDTRRRMCELEVELNQRLSKGVYLGVVPISRARGGGFQFGEAGEVVEYAVKMKQLPDECALSNLIPAGRVPPDQMTRLGEILAEFYTSVGRDAEIDRYGSPEVIEFNVDENFRQLKPFVGSLLKKDRFDFLMQSSRAFFAGRDALFARRVSEGRICDGHGDLRAEHIYLLDDFQIIDCIEFNNRFRYGDTAVDIAFLHMDLERLGGLDQTLAVLDGYMRASRDYGIFSMLDFYSCYRAIVKMKIACLSTAEPKDSARKDLMKERAATYLDLAFRYAVQFARPTVWVFCGMPGTGKSTLAKRIHEILDIELLRSDEARKHLPEYRAHGGPAPFGTGVYKLEMRSLVYGRLLATAQELLKKGRSVILDATFSKRKWREEALRLSQDLNANILFFECKTSMAAILERLDRRTSGADDQSDARSEHVPGFLVEFDAMGELDPDIHTAVNTETEVDENIRSILATAYSKKLIQVKRAIARL